ncbi:MAG: GLUG motif-containing protein, partial [Planctomycetota bacterium]
MATDNAKQLTVVLVLVLSAAGISFAKYSGGTGEPSDPYRIATAEDLNDIGNHVEDFNKRFVMVNDIDLAGYTGTQFNIIGDDLLNPFAGVFDGNGHTISNFSYNGGASEVGLFGRVWFYWCCDPRPRDTIKGLTLIDPNIIAQFADCAGALVGSLGEGTVRGCRIEGGRISGGSDCSVGGLVGHNGGIIEKCSSTASVSGGGCVGGLVGAMNVFKIGGAIDLISNCYSGGSVSGPAIFIGGLVGHIAHPIENSYSCAQVAEGPNAGG